MSDIEALRSRISGLERELTRINIGTSAAIAERRRMEAWFAKERPGMIGCSQTVLDLARIEQIALDEFAHVQRQLLSARSQLDAEFLEPSL